MTYYKFIDENNKLYGIACDGDPHVQDEKVIRVEITEKEYNKIYNEILEEMIDNDNTNRG